MVPKRIPPRKKTRDLPNLSECHNCSYRINTNNPKDKLQSLNSEWRVILLCKPCLRGIESSQLCSYCFSNVSDKEDEAESSFKCNRCSRCVHKECVVRYKSSAPWCYLNYYFCKNKNTDGSVDGDASDSFRICVDCWLPNEIVKSSAVMRESRRKRKISGIKSRSIISVGDENTDGDNSSMMKKRFEDAGKKPVCKSNADKNVMELANDAKKTNIMKKETKVENKVVREILIEDKAVKDKNVDDAELAFRLHRAMNSSPRIAKNLSSGNLRGVALSRSRLSDNDSFYGKSYMRKRRAMGGVDGHLIRTSDFKEDIVNLSLKDEEGSCSNNSMVTESDSFSCRKHEGQMPELQLNDCRDQNASNGYEESGKYLLKYNRKMSGLKPHKDHYYKFLYDACCLESQDPASTLLNCSGESRTVSETSFQPPYIVPVQTSTDASGSSQ